MSAPSAPRGVVAARLRQARQLRGFSQREVGVRMGLDKDTASARISRYESEAMAVSLDSLFELARALDVPPAYLLATTQAMADAILFLGSQSETQQVKLAEALAALVKLPVGQRKAFAEKLLNAESRERAQAR
ncbi:helix-turn-helix domain-containing protein [Rhodanobacter sp. TND4FH1]